VICCFSKKVILCIFIMLSFSSSGQNIHHSKIPRQVWFYVCKLCCVLVLLQTWTLSLCSMHHNLHDVYVCINTGSSPRYGKGFFSQSQLSVQTLIQCPYSLHVQSHASTSVCTLKIPDTGTVAAIPLLNTQKYYTHLGLGSTAPAAAGPYTGKAIQVSPQGTKKYQIKEKKW